MKRLFQIIIAGLLIQCQTERVNLNGHYISLSKFDDSSYMTLDIADSLVLINKNIVFADQRDTIVIDPKAKAFIRSTPERFSFFDFTVLKDTVILHYFHDAGEDKIKFLRGIASTHDYFSNSFVEIELEEFHNESKVTNNGFQIRNLTVGTLKSGVRMGAKADSIFIEYENEVFLNVDDISKIGPALDRDSIQDWSICLNVDKRVPSSVLDQLRSELVKNYKDKRLIETRIKGNELLYIKMTTAGNKKL